MTDWRLRESTQGKLALYKGNQLVADQVMPVLAFPFSAPDESISIVDEYSKELAWLDRLDQLDADSQAVVKNYLAVREFRPTVSVLRTGERDKKQATAWYNGTAIQFFKRFRACFLH